MASCGATKAMVRPAVSPWVAEAHPAGWPRLAGAWSSLRRDLALREASGEPAGRGLSQLVFDVRPRKDLPIGRGCPRLEATQTLLWRWRGVLEGALAEAAGRLF